MISSACLCDRRSFQTENWTPLVAECLKLTTKDLREASKAQERLAAVQSAALVGKSLLGISRLETGSYELLSATVTLTSRGTEFEGKRSHLAQSAGSLQRCMHYHASASFMGRHGSGTSSPS
ncbi:unnamed protein product [Polarella glacialis]|uniref:Uncharacterized protein n=1 Tax=Polarella glacialis TaxID=89957 RepID=A0A813JCA5_POLGL|nr:unnamed protein product [Polarella glacialis]